MGGQIVVESALDEGSTFSLSLVLPLATDEEQSALAPPAVTPGLGNQDATSQQPLRVLLAEDTVANQKIVKSILTRRGHAVEIASNGREVVDMIRYQPFDVVLMDVQMPVMDGYQATTAIRMLEAHLGQHVPIVALTAHAMQGDRQRCLAAGMDDYLVKPVRSAHLIELVERYSMNSNQTRQSADLKPAEATRRSAVDGAAFDLEAALARLGHDRAFFANLVDFFLEDYPDLLGRLREAAKTGDRQGSGPCGPQPQGAGRQL